MQIAERFDVLYEVRRDPSPRTRSAGRTARRSGPTSPARSVERQKKENGPKLLIQGSSGLVQLLLDHDLVDELRLLVYPVVLGRGKRLFAEGTTPAR